MATMINCAYCGKLTDPRLNACPHCHAPMRRGAGQPQQQAEQAPLAPQRPHALCPTCRAPVKQGDIICVKCGTNLLTGQQIINLPAAAAPAVERGGALRLLAVLLVLFLLAGGAGGAYYVLVYNEPVTRAKRAAAQNNLLEAVNTLSAYTQEHKDNAEAFTLLGQYEYRSQRYPEASAALSAAAKLRPADAALNYQAAAAAARVPNGGLNDQIAAFRRIVENAPADVEAQYLLAMALGAAGQYAEQAELLQRVAAAPTTETPAAGRYLGIAKALGGDLAGGAALVNESPDGQDKSIAKGLLANMQGDPEEAARELQGGIQGGAPAIQALAGTQLGLLLMGQGKFEEAMGVLRVASEAPQAPAAASFFYACCLQNAGLDTEALTEFATLAQGDGEFAPDAAAQMAQIYIQMDNPVKAEESLRLAMNGGKKSAKIYTLQGTLAAKDGDLQGAQQAYRMALSMDQDYAPAHLELGLARIAVQDLAGGVTELKKYLELAGDSREARGPEIKLLVGQLEQTLEKAGAAPGQSAAEAATRVAQEDAQ